MSAARELNWLLLMYSLPARRSSARVGLWRQLRKIGAVPFKTSTYILPDGPRHLEQYQWLAQQVREAGGEATIVHATDIEGSPDAEIVRLFNQARDDDFAELIVALRTLSRAPRKKFAEAALEITKLAARLEELRAIDFFGCAKREVAAMLLEQMRRRSAGKPDRRVPERVAPRAFQKKVWLTRPRPEIDRVGSAWLIRRFIDRQARFIFSANASDHPEAISFDMVGGRFTHVGDDCTFETLLKAFGIDDAVLQRIGEMVHAADLEDQKFAHAECIGIDRVLKGWARKGLSDDQLIERGAELFDALHEFLRGNS